LLAATRVRFAKRARFAASEIIWAASMMKF
jgi:hypothetical protein